MCLSTWLVVSACIFARQDDVRDAASFAILSQNNKGGTPQFYGPPACPLTPFSMCDCDAVAAAGGCRQVGKEWAPAANTGSCGRPRISSLVADAANEHLDSAGCRWNTDLAAVSLRQDDMHTCCDHAACWFVVSSLCASHTETRSMSGHFMQSTQQILNLCNHPNSRLICRALVVGYFIFSTLGPQGAGGEIASEVNHFEGAFTC